jgi:uncharacterized protein involved in exopolysaccharide biosynthesis
MAAAVPNALVREFVAADRRRRTQHVSEQVAFIDKRLTEVQAELAATEQALAQFRRRNRDLVDGESVFTNPDLVVEHSRLQREVDIRSSLLKTLLNQHEVARLAAKKEFRGVEVLAWAETPERPLRRQPNQQVLLGAAAGLMASVMLAFMLEYGRRSKEAGRMQPIIDDLHSDAQRLRNLLTRTQR